MFAHGTVVLNRQATSAQNGLILRMLSRNGLDCLEMLQFVNQSLKAV